MTVGSFRAKLGGVCDLHDCGRNIVAGDLIWYKHKAKGYFCCPECLAEAYPEEAENLKLPSSTRPMYEAAAPESDAAKGHRENMESAKKTRDMIGVLVVQLQGLGDNIHALTEALKGAPK